ncbi:SGNH/GDSL hydrolase family protein [Agrobacterium deltaense]
MNAPVSTTSIALKTVISDELIVNRDGSTSVQATSDLALQLASSWPLQISGNAGKLFTTYAQLAATAHGEFTPWVFADPDVSKNGLYRWTGAVWVWSLPLPYSFLIASNVSAGTPSAIKATTLSPVSTAALILLPIAEDYTGDAATVSFNGGAALTIKSNVGEDVTRLVAGSFVYGVISGGVFRLANDEAIASLIYKARDEAVSAANRADAEADRSHDEADRSEAARDVAAGYASDAISGGMDPGLSTVVGMGAITIPVGINHFHVVGYNEVGDGGGGLYIDQNNGSNDTFVTADGRTWYRAKDVSSERLRLPDAYLGYVATGALVPTALFATNKQSMTRSVHQMRDAVSSVRLLYPGFAVQENPAAETPIGAPALVRATVEYPEGIFNRVTFSGAETGTVPDGGLLLADELPVAIPRGAQFYVRTFYECTGGIIYTEWANAVMNFGVSGVADQTGGGTVVDGSAVDHGYGPVAILGMTNRPSVAIIGDSRATGTTDTLNESGERGTIMRSIGPEVAYSGIVKGGDRLMYWLASSTNRRQIASYASHIILQLGINDNRGGRTPAQMIADMQSIRALFPDKECYLTTFEPSSDSTDNWATLENQTTHNHNDRRVSLNNTIRSGGVAGFEGYFELADVMESSRDSGLVRVNGTANYWTPDGLHWNQRGNIFIEQSGAVRATPFFDPLTDRSLRPASADDMRIGKATDAFVSPATFMVGLREHGFRLVASNANGNAYASRSGLQVCISPEIDLSALPVTTAAGSLFVSASQVWAFPRNFAVPPMVSGQPMRSNDTVVAGVSFRSSPTTSAINYLFWLSTSTAGVSGRTVRLCAIGIGSDQSI